MASNTQSHETHLEEGLLLPVVADEKRTLLTDISPPGPGYPHEKSQKPRRTRIMAVARRFLIFALCFVVSFGLASVISSPHLRCTRHHNHDDIQATLPEAHATVSELSEPVNAPEPDLFHRILHAYFPKALQDALPAVEAKDAGLASTIAHLAKRQDGNDTEPTPSPTPSEPTTERTPEPTPTEPPTSTQPPPPPPPPTTRTTQPPPSPPPPPPPSPSPPPPSPSPPPPPPPPPPPSSEPQNPTTSAPPPPPSPEPTESATSTAAEPSEPGSSRSSSEEESTTNTRRTTTRSTASFQSSSEVVTTRTSTDADGDITIITETSFVGVDPTPHTTGASGQDPDLQNVAPRNGAAGVIAAGLVAMGAALLL